VTAIVAAYDEADRIGATIAALREAFPEAPVWVADDGSRDATASIARDAGARVVSAGRVIGKGGAMTAAARAALRERQDASRAAPPEHPPRGAGEAGAEMRAQTPAAARGPAVFVLCDGDLGASARELHGLADAVARGDGDVAVAVFATRVGGGVGAALGFARWAIRRRCGLRTRAPISGQRALTEAALRDVLPFAHGYGMEIGITIDAVRAGHRVVELALDLHHRATGRSLSGFAHRARQLLDFVRVYASRARPRARE
jgi:hypothetical protein